MAGEPDFLELMRRAQAASAARTRRLRKRRRRHARRAPSGPTRLDILIDDEGRVLLAPDDKVVTP